MLNGSDVLQSYAEGALRSVVRNGDTFGYPLMLNATIAGAVALEIQRLETTYRDKIAESIGGRVVNHQMTDEGPSGLVFFDRPIPSPDIIVRAVKDAMEQTGLHVVEV
jgi:hypothetical protein